MYVKITNINLNDRNTEHQCFRIIKNWLIIFYFDHIGIALRIFGMILIDIKQTLNYILEEFLSDFGIEKKGHKFIFIDTQLPS